jgi:hypothetical protein
VAGNVLRQEDGRQNRLDVARPRAQGGMIRTKFFVIKSSHYKDDVFLHKCVLPTVDFQTGEIVTIADRPYRVAQKAWKVGDDGKLYCSIRVFDWSQVFGRGPDLSVESHAPPKKNGRDPG